MRSVISMKITIDLIEEGIYRALLIKINNVQKEQGLPTFTLEEFVSMILADKATIETLKTLADSIK